MSHIQPPAFEFDPNIYFDLVAGNLFKNFGDHALWLAGEALGRMRRSGDEEGFELWEGINLALHSIAMDRIVANSSTVH